MSGVLTTNRYSKRKIFNKNHIFFNQTIIHNANICFEKFLAYFQELNCLLEEHKKFLKTNLKHTFLSYLIYNKNRILKYHQSNIVIRYDKQIPLRFFLIICLIFFNQLF